MVKPLSCIYWRVLTCDLWKPKTSQYLIQREPLATQSVHLWGWKEELCLAGMSSPGEVRLTNFEPLCRGHLKFSFQPDGVILGRLINHASLHTRLRFRSNVYDEKWEGLVGGAL